MEFSSVFDYYSRFEFVLLGLYLNVSFCIGST